MISPSTIAQANDTALAAKSLAQQWWPTLCALAILLGRELRNFNAWLGNVSGYVIAHGGLALILWKLLWNPQANNPSTPPSNQPLP